MNRHFILFAMLAAAVSCGEASGGSGALAEGGIGGSGISQGPITDFGSIFVNDIEWFLDGAEIEFDGEVLEIGEIGEIGEEELFRLGMVVRVEGEIDASTGTGQAKRVFFDDEIEGPVSAVEAVIDMGVPGQFRAVTVLGQRILIEAGVTRFFDDDDSDFGFDTIVVGDVVEVSGLVDQDGVLRATFVEREGEATPGVTEVELKGTVSGLAPGGTTFMLGSVTIDFDPSGGTTDLSDLPGGVVELGMYVEVEGTLAAANRITALEIELEDEFDDDDAEEFSTTGFVNQFNGLDDFYVGNQRVDASDAEFEHGTSAMLENGRRVEVEGELIDGLLFAEEVEFEDQEVRVHAAIAGSADIDVIAGTLVLLGIEIRVLPSTQFEDDLNGGEGFGLADLQPGDFVEVDGIANAQGVITAFEVERDESDTIRLRGPVAQFDETTGELVILGVTVTTGGGTDFEINGGEVGASDFFDALNEGDFVEAQDDSGSDTVLDLATDVELEEEDE